MYRQFIFLTFITLFGTSFRASISLPFDGVTGTWKRTSLTMLDASGKKNDMLQMMTKSRPCMKDITYTFSSDGQLKSSVPESCGAIKKAVESMNASARWSIAGRKLTVTTTMKDFPTTTYDISFQGNRMTWLFIFADNPKTPNPTKARQMITVYERI